VAPDNFDDALDELDDLPVVELEDAELGIRSEDRYAAIPPGPKLIRRRVHDQSSRAPAYLLVALFMLVALAAWLGRGDHHGATSSDAAGTAGEQVIRVFRHLTNAQAVLRSGNALFVVDVDRGSIVPLQPRDLPAQSVDRLIATGRTLVVQVTGHAYAVRGAALSAPAVDLGPAETVVAATEPERVWIAALVNGRYLLREVATDGTTIETAQLQPTEELAGATTGGVLLSSNRPSRVTQMLPRDGSRRQLGGNAVFIASNANVVVTAETRGGLDYLNVDDTARGRHSSFQRGRLLPDLSNVSLSPDGSRLAFTNPSTAGVTLTIIDLHTEHVVSREATPVADAPTAWSPDSRWLFAGAPSGGLLAIDRQGTAAVVDAPVDPFSLITVAAAPLLPR
jgi:hypothetical protein